MFCPVLPSFFPPLYLYVTSPHDSCISEHAEKLILEKVLSIALSLHSTLPNWVLLCADEFKALL